MTDAFDYVKDAYRFQRHVQRYRRRAERDGLHCQECGGHGGWTDVIYDGQGPWEVCGFCHGGGYVTRHMRGVWLRYRRGLRNWRTKKAGAARG